jgi:hypothetical protein
LASGERDETFVVVVVVVVLVRIFEVDKQIKNNTCQHATSDGK